MNQPIAVFGLIGVGLGLTAGMIYRQRSNGASNGTAKSIAIERTGESSARRRFWLGRSRAGEVEAIPKETEIASRLALIAHPAPSRTKLVVAGVSGVLAAWGGTRGGLLGNAAGVAGAAMLGRIASR